MRGARGIILALAIGQRRIAGHHGECGDAGDAVLADATAPLADGTRVRFTASKAAFTGGSAARNELPASRN